MVRICLALIFFVNVNNSSRLLLPIQVKDRTTIEPSQLTGIGQFGLKRKARPTVPVHFHTGIDLKRPSNKYANEPVYAAGQGKVISMRNDGPFSQIIIEHPLNSRDTLWTVYEHILGISCHAGETVTGNTVIARFFNKAELDKYGWQFDHIHFEIMKARPLKVKTNSKFPEYHYKTYAITCYTTDELHKRMINPLEYFKK